MKTLAHPLAITICCLAAHGSVHAQPAAPTAADVRMRLHSTSATDVAWAAFDAATFRMAEIAPDLIAALESPPEAPPRERDYLAAVLDALVQLRATPRFQNPVSTPAAAVLDRYHRRWPVQTLILMPPPGAGRGELLEPWLRSASSGLEWFAIANALLTEEPPPHGFAADLLEGVSLALNIFVVDKAGNGMGFGTGSLSAGVGDGIGENPRGYPPHAICEFESGDPVGAVVLARGPRTAYYSRRVTNEFQFGVGSLIGYWPSTNERLEYVNAMVAGRFRFFLREMTSVNIKWRNERSLRACINIERNKIADEHGRMLKLLVDGHYLTAEEARGLPLKLTLHVYDTRARRSEPLPANLESNVNPNREPGTQKCEP